MVLKTWLIIFVLIPLTLVVFASFLTSSDTNLLSFPLTLSHYKTLLTPIYIKVFARSLLLASFTTLLCVLIAYPFCFVLIQSKFKSLLLLLIVIPFWTSSLIRTYSLIAILKANGLINTLLFKLHLISHPLDLLYTNTAVIIGLVYNLLPFMILPLYANMERFDFKLIQEAQDLGAKNITILLRVLLPNTLEGIIAGTTLVLLPAMTLFYIPNILGGAKSILLGNLIQNQFLVLLNWPQGAASSMLLSIILIVLFMFYRIKNKVLLR